MDAERSPLPGLTSDVNVSMVRVNQLPRDCQAEPAAGGTQSDVHSPVIKMNKMIPRTTRPAFPIRLLLAYGIACSPRSINGWPSVGLESTYCLYADYAADL